MKELQELGKELVDRIKRIGFRNIEFFVDIEDREKSRAEISFIGEEGKARSFGGYIESHNSHYNDALIGFINSGEGYKITLTPNPDMIRHGIDRKTALMHTICQLIKDIENYKMRR